jgi:DNA polymerase-3 subunit epsilon
MVKRKLLILDVETTGLSHFKDSIVEIAAYYYENNKKKKIFNMSCKPKKGSSVEPGSIAAGIVPYTNMSYEELYWKFIEFLDSIVNKFDKEDKLILTAYNSAFDEKFIRQFFKDNNNKFYGSYFKTKSLDVLHLAHMHMIVNNIKYDKLNLKSTCENLKVKVDEDKTHRALYDVNLTQQVLAKVSKSFI